jgi:hypothetical protein
MSCFFLLVYVDCESFFSFTANDLPMFSISSSDSYVISLTQLLSVHDCDNPKVVHIAGCQFNHLHLLIGFEF